MAKDIALNSAVPELGLYRVFTDLGAPDRAPEARRGLSFTIGRLSRRNICTPQWQRFFFFKSVRMSERAYMLKLAQSTVLYARWARRRCFQETESAPTRWNWRRVPVHDRKKELARGQYNSAARRRERDREVEQVKKKARLLVRPDHIAPQPESSTST